MFFFDSSLKRGESIPVAMTIAGSDSGGGAGIQTDLRTFAAFGVFGASAITCATSQNPTEVAFVEPLSGKSVSTQIQTVFRKQDVRFLKTGMLFSTEIIDAVADSLRDRTRTLIVDPVMVSTSGARLLCDDAVETMRKQILPLASWITPNLPEAEILAGHEVRTFEDQLRAVKELHACWNCGVVLKGGHSHDPARAVDLICTGNQVFQLSARRLPVLPYADHGTGCTFSAALTAALAAGMELKQALTAAKAFVLGELDCARQLGPGVYGMVPPSDLTDYLKLVTLEKL